MNSSRVALVGAAAAAFAAALTLVSAPSAAVAAIVAAFVCAFLAFRAPSAGARADPGDEARDAPDAGLSELAPLLEALPDPALLIDADGRVAGSNAAARADLQFEAAGLRLSALLRNPDLLDAVQAAVSDGAARTVEYETVAQVGQHIRCYVAPVTWGAHRAALMVFHDETARINTERMRADFLANASHELRTPLASLKLLLETITGPARDDPHERDRFVRMMQTQADRMGRLVDDLLSLSRIELDEHVPPADRVDLNHIAAEVVDNLAAHAQSCGVRVTLAVSDEPVVITGERFQLVQVIQNLVDNAVKFSRSGGEVAIEVGRALSREQAVESAGRRWSGASRIALITPAPASNRTYAFVRVTDSGPGVAQRFLPRLGERFFRVAREIGDERGGTGLGLAIVKHIINRHRGGFVIESVVGEGSAFSVYFEAVTGPVTTSRRAPASL